MIGLFAWMVFIPSFIVSVFLVIVLLGAAIEDPKILKEASFYDAGSLMIIASFFLSGLYLFGL